jgi:hypothetical protein
MKKEGIRSAINIDESLILAGNGQKCAIAETFQGISLSLGAVHRMGWINLGSPKMHGFKRLSEYLINLARADGVDYARQDHLKHGAAFSLVSGLDPSAVGNGDLLHDR